MISMVLSKTTLSVLSTKVSQDFPFIRKISRAVDETVFWFAIWAIYISFLALFCTLSCCGVSLRQRGFSSIIPAMTSTAGILLGRFFIRKFYYTFVNIFWNFHTLKHSNSLFKQNEFAIKTLNIGFLYDILGMLFKIILFNSIKSMISDKVAP